jgi:hypothetical protein
MPVSMSRSWRRDSNERASDEPGAVQLQRHAVEGDLAARRRD